MRQAGLPGGGHWGSLSMCESVTDRVTASQASGGTVSTSAAASGQQQRDGVHLTGPKDGGCRAVAVALQGPDPPDHLAQLDLPQAPLVGDGRRGLGRTSRAALQGRGGGSRRGWASETTCTSNVPALCLRCEGRTNTSDFRVEENRSCCAQQRSSHRQGSHQAVSRLPT